MRDLLQDLKAFFVSNGVALPIFIDATPDSPDNVIALYEYQGTMPIPQIAGSDRALQVVVRSASASIARDMAKTLHKQLMTEDGIIQLTEERWTTIFLRQTPFKMKVDSSNRSYYAFNISMTTYID